ncbi:MAG: hypothetical protein ACRCT1_17505, partial [Microcoleaceae cyanobacterium]
MVLVTDRASLETAGTDLFNSTLKKNPILDNQGANNLVNSGVELPVSNLAPTNNDSLKALNSQNTDLLLGRERKQDLLVTPQKIANSTSSNGDPFTEFNVSPKTDINATAPVIKDT